MTTIEYVTRPCVGCGYCCKKRPCPLAMITYRLEPGDKCPELYWNGEKYRCGKAVEWGTALAIGAGCSSSLNSWRKDVRYRG